MGHRAPLQSHGFQARAYGQAGRLRIDQEDAQGLVFRCRQGGEDDIKTGDTGIANKRFDAVKNIAIARTRRDQRIRADPWSGAGLVNGQSA